MIVGMNSGKLRVIYSTTLAKRLIEKGFVVRDIKPNEKDRKRTVFLFDDSKDVEIVVNEFARR